MLFRPDATDFRLILRVVGRVVFATGLAALVPLLAAVAWDETSDAWSFLLAASIAVVVGCVAEVACATRARLDASQALAAVAASWLVVPLFAALPLLLSGHYASVLDAYFEAISGLATVGLTMANDLDHMSRSVNLWRHLLQFLGGQATIVVGLTAFLGGSRRLGTLYEGGTDVDVILPSMRRAAGFVVRFAALYGLCGIAALWLAVAMAGLPPVDAVYHAVNLFLSAFDTGGFTTVSGNVAVYRSPAVEAVLLVLMVTGALGIAVRSALWQGRRGDLWRHTESRTLVGSMLLLLAIMCIGLVRAGTFADPATLVRHSLFQIVSAHTTTGLATVPMQLFATDWGALAPATLVAAMGIGGMAGATAGGIKAIRVGLLLKGIGADIRRVLLPESSVMVDTYLSRGRRVLRDAQVRDAALLLLLWLLLYLTGAIIGLFYRYPLELSLFESTAAASSGAFTVGIVRPALETPMKVVYLLQMVTGRLEFVAVFALAGYAVSIVRGRV